MFVFTVAVTTCTLLLRLWYTFPRSDIGACVLACCPQAQVPTQATHDARGPVQQELAAFEGLFHARDVLGLGVVPHLGS